MESWKVVLGVRNNIRKEESNTLHQLTRSTDNVHCTREGSENLASVIHNTGTKWDIESASALLQVREGAEKAPSSGGV